MDVVSCSVLFEPCSYGCGLPMSAAVAAAAVKATTTVEATTAAHCAAAEAAADCYMRGAATEPADRAAPSVAVTVPAVGGAKTASAPTTSAPAAVEPRARSDEETTGEVARTVVAVRRARVRVIPVVTVGANRSRTDIPWANAHAHRKALSASVRREGQGRSKYRKNQEIFHEMFHIWAPSEPVKPF